tara:strand:- start:39 stop:476 length:438 start_codon:yes stop_codon:yes gene_type:complete
MSHEDDYEVGYGRPPRASRFKPGQSGNPNGRRKKVIGGLGEHLRAAVNQTIEVKVGGVKKKMSFQEAIATRLANDALTGSVADRIKLLDALHKYAPDLLETLPDEEDRQLTIHFVKPGADGRLMKYDNEGNPLSLSRDDIRKHSE